MEKQETTENSQDFFRDSIWLWLQADASEQVCCSILNRIKSRTGCTLYLIDKCSLNSILKANVSLVNKNDWNDDSNLLPYMYPVIQMATFQTITQKKRKKEKKKERKGKETFIVNVFCHVAFKPRGTGIIVTLGSTLNYRQSFILANKDGNG